MGGAGASAGANADGEEAAPSLQVIVLVSCTFLRGILIHSASCTASVSSVPASCAP